MIHLFALSLLALFTSCSRDDRPFTELSRRENQVAENITRTSNEHLFRPTPPKLVTPTHYPWENDATSIFPKITKEFFRCNGSELNPVHTVPAKNNESVYQYDCGGAERHSLPLKDEKEFVYPILVDLLNYVQNTANKRVVITSGHRCPTHNTYVDPSPRNSTSKHMLGAAVAFYVQSLEQHPEKVVQMLLDYYQKTPKYVGQKDFQEFTRHQDKGTDISTPGWMNKEIYVKLYTKTEGRDFDNRHTFPYIEVQVRYDWDTKEKVVYTHDKANRNFLRW